MKNALVILYGTSKPIELGVKLSFKNILFTSPFDWLGITLKRLGLDQTFLVTPDYIQSNFIHISPLEITNKLKESSANDILLLSVDRPLISTDIIENAYNNYKAHSISTLISDIDNNTSGIGWYSKDVLTDLLNKDIVSLSCFYKRLKETKTDYTKHYYPVEYLLCSDTPKGYNKISTIARNMVIEGLLDNGVDIPIADGIIVSPCSTIKAGATILPGTIIKNASIIEKDCEIGPNSYIESSTIKSGAKIISSYIEGSVVGSDSVIGPMSRLRPNSNVGEKVKIGNFVEVKNTSIGNSTSVSHLTYIGDSDIGSDCNFGCGVVTVNYDGTNKHRTTVGNGVFVGCNCNLVAPVKLEDGVYAAAGTTITEDVSKDAMVIGRVRQSVKENWRAKKGLFNKE